MIAVALFSEKLTYAGQPAPGVGELRHTSAAAQPRKSRGHPPSLLLLAGLGNKIIDGAPAGSPYTRQSMQ